MDLFAGDLAGPSFERPAFFEVAEPVEFLFIDTVGSGADIDADDVGMAQGFSVQLPESRERGVCVGVGLEVGDVVRGVAVADFVEFYAFVDLPCKAFPGSAVARMKGVVVLDVMFL